MTLKRGFKQLIDEANERIETLGIDDAKALLDDPNVQWVDIRDLRELEREGMIPGAFHAPRGMLEFWIDPDSPYHKEVFDSGKKFLLYCGSAWRSALATATLIDMGFENVCHLEGGFSKWKKSGGTVVEHPEKSA
ncbi:MAG: rhodanese-like domain-containing protein [Alphaproteobacteria bacterium]|nr:rhodanese-like domain-containing protein [Alphaproteobacteria bacterium]